MSCMNTLQQDTSTFRNISRSRDFKTVASWKGSNANIGCLNYAMIIHKQIALLEAFSFIIGWGNGCFIVGCYRITSPPTPFK